MTIIVNIIGLLISAVIITKTKKHKYGLLTPQEVEATVVESLPECGDALLYIRYKFAIGSKEYFGTVKPSITQNVTTLGLRGVSPRRVKSKPDSTY